MERDLGKTAKRKGEPMYRIMKKAELRPTLMLLEIEAPRVARKARPGQFIILRVDKGGERIPITIHDVNHVTGGVSIIVQVVGSTTYKLNRLREGDFIQDFVGPLGRATDITQEKVCVIGGGVGCAIAYPVLKAFRAAWSEVHAIIGFRSADLVILEDEFRASSELLRVCTDDGSYGEKGFVTDALVDLIEAGNHYDEVFAVGPVGMQRGVSRATEPYGIKTTVSMAPLMIDGTGMCGCCRVSIGGEMKYACVDGPDFDAHKVDWDLAVQRSRSFYEFERHKYEETCNLFKKEVQ